MCYQAPFAFRKPENKWLSRKEQFGDSGYKNLKEFVLKTFAAHLRHVMSFQITPILHHKKSMYKDDIFKVYGIEILYHSSILK